MKKEHELIELIISFNESVDSCVVPLSFNAYSKTKKAEISQALAVWEFLRSFNRRSDLTSKEKSQLILGLQHQAICDKNPFIKVLVMIESLPTSVWRELLWQENLDFMSFESFLRRLSKKQIKAIEENFSDYHEKTNIPRVMKKSWRKKIRIFFGNISFQKLQTEEYDYEKRYASKNAWAYNLLGLDFGFSLYSKGENDDQKITNKSFTRFLSIKEHINDFVVSQENGKYWWMYKTARSNYAFFPNKEVEIKDHVCPGFWFTIIIHAWFWLFSPIVLLSTTLGIWQFGWSWATLSPAIFALPLLAWLLLVSLRLIWQAIAGFFNSSYYLMKQVKTDTWWLKALTFIGKTILILLALFLALVILLSIALQSIEFFNFVIPILGRLLSVFLYLAFIYYALLVVNIVFDFKAVFNYKKTPKVIRYWLNASIFASAVVLLDKFVTYHVFKFIASTALFIFSWFSDNLMIGIWLLVIGSFIAFFIYLFIIFEKNEKKFARYSRIIDFVSIIFIIISVSFLILSMLIHGGFSLLSFGHLPVLFLAFAIIGIGLILSMKGFVNQNTIYYRNMARSLIVKRKYVNQLASRNEFKELIKEEELFSSLSKFSYSFLDLHCYRFRFFQFVLGLSKEDLRKILSMEEEIMQVNRYLSDYYRSRFIEILVANDFSIKKTLEKREEERIKERKIECEHIQSNKEAREMMLQPFTWMRQKIYRFFATLKDLWDFFNKRCPYVSKSKVLY